MIRLSVPGCGTCRLACFRALSGLHRERDGQDASSRQLAVWPHTQASTSRADELHITLAEQTVEDPLWHPRKPATHPGQRRGRAVHWQKGCRRQFLPLLLCVDTQATPSQKLQALLCGLLPGADL